MATSVIDTKLKQERLLRIIEDELQDLPPLPAVVMRVMQTINDPTTSALDLNRLISGDPALAAKVLRLVNSSYYGFPRRIATVTHAVVILGFNTVRNLTTSLGVFNAFDTKGQKTALDRDKFWAHGLATAVAAGVIARRKNIAAKMVEEVFIGGLLHDLGKLFLDQYFPDQYAIALRLAATAKISIWDAEKTALGVGHALVGKRIAEKWNLPPSLTSMIMLHHQPAFAKEHFEITAIIQAADMVARKLNLGSGGDPLVPSLSPEVQQWLNLPAPVWAAIEQETCQRFEAAKDFLLVVKG